MLQRQLMIVLQNFISLIDFSRDILEFGSKLKLLSLNCAQANITPVNQTLLIAYQNTDVS